MKIQIIFILAIFFSILLPPQVESIRINEIMYNPAGDDYDFEFIELYSNEIINISNYYFEGIDFIFPENSTLNNYLVIVNTCNDSGDYNDFFDCYQINCSFEYQGTLSNNGETIILFSPDGGIATQVNYSDTAPENYSLELTSNGWLVSEIEGGTPGSENSHLFSSVNSTINESLNETVNNTNTTINNSVNVTNNNTNVTINNTINETSNTIVNETLNLTDNNSINTTNIACDHSLKIETDKINFSNGEQIKFGHIITNKTDSYQIEYWIEDLFGTIVKSKRNTTNTNEKSYTPNINEKDKILVIRNILYVECNDTNLSNNYAEKLVFVVNNEYSEEKEDENEKKSSQTNKQEKISKPKISSFYTLTKNFEANKTIKFFSYISNSGPGSEFSLFFNHDSQLIQTQNLALQEDEVKRVSFETTLKKGNNSFSLKLHKNNYLVDYKELSIFVNDTETFKNKSIKVDNKGEEKFINNTRLQLDIKKEIDEGKLKKKSSIAYYIFLGLSVVFNAILIWKR